ncbi:ATP-dependent nuclease [Salinicola rhizosphaerae]|uniref:ATP-dependent endonuclease n=1 Tax=Salinicola rhizosphaerae TaxID=1443141 RepID=A0ABQ3EC87_9GAMM|nr:AAA family ATPase [Salinicola rhizosphaerae]GHB33013.1 ATP-dependent endonuclease [Salinicola rhizosphaerae]
MTSFISSVSIDNYRSFSQECRVALGPLSSLVGYNNAGKSNILNAIEWLVSNGSLSEQDFNKKDSAVVVFAEIKNISNQSLARLGDTHRRRVEKYINQEKLLIKRSQEEPGTKATANKLALYNPEEEIWDENPSGIDAAIKRLFPDVIRINAMDDAAADASKAKTSSTIGKLLKEVSGSIIDRHQQEVDSSLGVVRGQLSAEGVDRFAALNEIDERMNASVASFFPRVSVKLDIPVPDMEELFGSGTIKIYEDDAEIGRPIQYYGHGSQRSVQMALIKLLADIRASSQNEDNPAPRLLLIDEPELYLHPFAIDVLFEAFKILAESGYQVVYSTHSGQLIDKSIAPSVVLVRKSADLGTYVRKPLTEAVHEVVNKPEHLQEVIYSLSQATQIFFSEKVLVVEGKTEQRLIPLLYRFFNGKVLGVNHIGITGLAGKDLIPKAHRVLSAMDIPSKFVADLDFAFKLASASEFLSSEDVSYKALLAILKDLETRGSILLDDKGHPKSKKAPCTAEEAYHILATTDGASEHIERIHDKLLEYNIWVWPLGSIEHHIGNDSKDELGLIRYMEKLRTHGVEATCPDPGGICRFISWIDEK